MISWAASPSSPAWVQSDFWFRDDDGNEITATGLADDDIPKSGAVIIAESDYGRKRVFRLRIGFRVQQADGNIRPRLEFKESQTADCNETGDWQVVGLSDSAARYTLRDSPNLTNASLTTQQITGGQFVSGKFLDFENPSAEAQAVTKNYRTEYEWSAEYNAAEFTPDKKYIFRVTDNGAPFSNYIQCPIIYFSQITRSGQPTEIKFSGQAFPEGKTIIYVKAFGTDVPIKQEEIKSQDGSFSANYIGILQNVYTYSLVITDREGRLSQTKNYNLDVYANTLTAKDIFAPPTIDLVRKIVTKGDFLVFTGYASPNNDVEFEIDGGVASGKTKAGSDGLYKWLFNTSGLIFGDHRARARQAESLLKKSDWSVIQTFKITALLNPKTDLNSDGIINIKDWSIFLAKWRSEDPIKRKEVDLNSDGKVDLSDFSIFVRTIPK